MIISPLFFDYCSRVHTLYLSDKQFEGLASARPDRGAQLRSPIMGGGTTGRMVTIARNSSVVSIVPFGQERAVRGTWGGSLLTTVAQFPNRNTEENTEGAR
jgi:hypothetical protein